MDVGEFRRQFMEQLRFDAEHAGSEPEAQFIEKSLDLLEEIGDVTDPMPMSIEMRGRRNRRMAFDAYAYDGQDRDMEGYSTEYGMPIRPVVSSLAKRLIRLRAEKESYNTLVSDEAKKSAPTFGLR